MDGMRRRARDPNTSWKDLRHMAATRPDLHADLAANPNLYPELRAWLSTLDDPEVQRVLAGGPLTGSLPVVASPQPAPPSSSPARPLLIGTVCLLIVALAVLGIIITGRNSGTETAVSESANISVSTNEPRSLPAVDLPELPTPAPSGSVLPMTTDYTGPITTTPYDHGFADGIVPGHELTGKFIGMSSDLEIVVTTTGDTVYGWSLTSGEQIWDVKAQVDVDWDPYLPQSAGNLIIAQNQGIDMASGEIQTFDVPPTALFCGGLSDLAVFADGPNVIAFKRDGSLAWGLENVLDGYEVGSCGFHDTYVRIHPTARQVAPATVSASTGSAMTLPGLSGWYDASYLLPNGVLMSSAHQPAGWSGDIEPNMWAAWDLNSGDLLASAPFDGSGPLPRLYSSTTSDINLYATAINNGWDSGYLIARGSQILATTDAVDGLVTTIKPVNGPEIALPSPITAGDVRHTISVLDDDDTLIISPARSREGDPTYDGFVATYSLSQGKELWMYKLGPTEQVFATRGFFWVVSSDTLDTIFYTPAQ